MSDLYCTSFEACAPMRHTLLVKLSSLESPSRQTSKLVRKVRNGWHEAPKYRMRTIPLQIS